MLSPAVGTAPVRVLHLNLAANATGEGIDAAGYPGAIQIVGTFSARVYVEASLDDVTWYKVDVTDAAGSSADYASAAGIFYYGSGFRKIRATVTNYVSGTLSVYQSVAMGSAGVSGGGGGGGGDASEATLATVAKESGGNLAALAASASVLDDWDESDRAKVNPIAGQAGVQGGAGAVTALTQRVVVATDQAAVPVSAASLPLPSGAATQTTLAAVNTLLTDVYDAVNHWLRVTIPKIDATTDSITIAAIPAGANRIGTVGIADQVGVIAATNSSTTNLAASATFTGTGTDFLPYAAITLGLQCNQNCTIQVQQSSDNSNWDLVDSFTSTGGTHFTRVVNQRLAFFRVLVTNNGGSTTTTLRLQTIKLPILSALPRTLTNSGNLKVSLEELVASLVLSASSAKIGSVGLDAQVSTAAISTTANLASAATFTSSSRSALGLEGVGIAVFVDQAATLNIDYSQDGTNWDETLTRRIDASTAFSRAFGVPTEFYRVRLTNDGGSTTTALRLEVIEMPIMAVLPKALSERGSLKVAAVEHYGLTWSGSNGTAISASANTAAIAAPAANRKLQIHRLYACNFHATQAVNIYWRDGAAGAQIMPTRLDPLGGTFTIDLEGSLELTAATALYLNTDAAGTVQWSASARTVGA